MQCVARRIEHEICRIFKYKKHDLIFLGGLFKIADAVFAPEPLHDRLFDYTLAVGD